MKKILYTIALFIMFIGITNAAKCNVISGTGKNIGDEIVCGTEHFYVISNDGTDIKMLAKYNLLAGTTVERISFDEYESTGYNGIYESPIVQEKIKDGYYVYNALYNYDNTTSKYSFYGAIMHKELDENSTAIFFDEPKSTVQETITSEEVKEMVEKGYIYSNAINDSSGKVIGARFYKVEGYEFKTIIFDSVQNMNFQELYNLPEVKKYIDDNYAVDTVYYNTHQCNSTNVNCTEDFYGIVLYKSYEEEFYNIIFDKAYDTTTEVEEYLASNEEYQQKIKEGYIKVDEYQNYEYASSTSKYLRTFGIFLSKDTGKTLEQNVYQDETAIGAHGDEKGNPDPIEVAITYLSWELNYKEDGNLDLTDSNAGNYLIQYKNTLEKQGYETKDVYLLTLDDLLYVLAGINGVEADWDNLDLDWEWEYVNGAYRTSLLNVIPDEYSWIYSTTYWTATDDGDGYVYFIDTLGDLCSTYDWCDVNHEIGAGIRPVVTISSNDLIYKITTKTDGNGSVTAITESKAGEGITFEVTPKEGYVLSEVKVTDSEGNIVTFTDYKFTMPEANVIIEATFTVENSETSATNILLSVVLILISLGIFYNFKKKASWIET